MASNWFRKAFILATWLAVALLLFAFSALPAAQAEQRTPKKPNIVVFVIDDLDNHMGTMNHMPFLQSRLVKEGTTFTNAVVTTALCCPTRTTFLTGLLAHNSNFTSTMDPFGGYEPYWTRGFVDDYLPVWLQDAGYKTYFVGKLVNGVTTANYHRPLPGWDIFDVMLLPYLYDYLNPVFSRNGNPPKHYRGQYQTDVITKKVLDILTDTPQDKPFFMYIAPGATHSTFKFPEVRSELPTRDPFLPYEALGLGWTYPIPAKRHEHLFPDAKVPRTPWFDPDVFENKPSWHKKLKRKTPKQLEEMDKWHRARLRTVQAVDETIEHIWLELEKSGRAEETYFVFLSDNGYHLGHLRMNVGKSSPYETDIRIPFLIRGPGVPKGEVSDQMVTAADLAPTVMKMAGIEPKEWMDGRPIDLAGGNDGGKGVGEAFLVEYWDFAADEGFQNVYYNNMYKSIRILSAKHNLYFAIWCTNETEFYDLRKEPWQLRNTESEMDPRLKTRMEALVKTMKECKGKGCRDPWSVIHPDGSVKDLDDAMDPKHDALYALIKPFRYGRCLRHMTSRNEKIRPIPPTGNHPPPIETARINPQSGDIEWTLVSDPKAKKKTTGKLAGPQIPLLEETHGIKLDEHACAKRLMEAPKGTNFGFKDIPSYLWLRWWQATTMSAWNFITWLLQLATGMIGDV